MRDDLDWAVWSRERQQRVELVLDAALPSVAGPASTLTEAMRYAVLGGGKRVRPLLAYAAGELAEAPPEATSRDSLQSPERRLERLFRRHPLSAAATAAYVCLMMIDLQRLRGLFAVRALRDAPAAPP